MKIDTNESFVLSTAQETTQFKAKVSPKMFNILCNTLYEDKVGAVIREICANAYDSHIQAGKADVPFTVQLPTDFDPVFYVEDFGVGMSHSDVVNIYTTIFESTKTDSNDLIGAMGLGSKTPLSYTKQFNVISRHNGEETVYSIHFSSDGIPVCDKIVAYPTTEINGVRVSVPVRKEDFEEFRQKAEYYLMWYAVKPTIKPKKFADDMFHQKPETNTDYMMTYERLQYLNSRSFICLMGNVPYPVDFSEFEYDDLTSVERSLVKFYRERTGLVVKFNIGELNVSASRETLSLDERTKLMIRDKVVFCFKTMLATLTDKTQHIKNRFDFIHECREFFGKNLSGIRIHLPNALSHKYNFLDVQDLSFRDVDLHLKGAEVWQKGRHLSNSMASNRYDIRKYLNHGEITIVAGKDVAKIKSPYWNKLSKEYIQCNEKMKGLVFLYPRKISQTTLNRISTMLGSHVKVRCYEATHILSEIKATKPKRLGGERTPKNVIKCDYFSIVEGRFFNHTPNKFLYDALLLEESEIDMNEVSSDVGVFSLSIPLWDKFEQTPCNKNNLINNFKKELGLSQYKEIVLIKETAKISKKLRKLSINPFTGVIDKLFTNQKTVRKLIMDNFIAVEGTRFHNKLSGIFKFYEEVDHVYDMSKESLVYEIHKKMVKHEEHPRDGGYVDQCRFARFVCGFASSAPSHFIYHVNVYLDRECQRLEDRCLAQYHIYPGSHGSYSSINREEYKKMVKALNAIGYYTKKEQPVNKSDEVEVEYEFLV